MTLNRNSIWTTEQGKKIRVKDMSFADLFTALAYLELLDRDESSGDPFVLHQMCKDLNCCSSYVEPVHTVDGYSLDDWRWFLDDRMEQLERIQERMNRYPKEKTNFFLVLVKSVKFW